jgi:hypothetical protein
MRGGGGGRKPKKNLERLKFARRVAEYRKHQYRVIGYPGSRAMGLYDFDIERTTARGRPVYGNGDGYYLFVANPPSSNWVIDREARLNDACTAVPPTFRDSYVSAFRGVEWCQDDEQWSAVVAQAGPQGDGIQFFDDEISAALAHDAFIDAQSGRRPRRNLPRKYRPIRNAFVTVRQALPQSSAHANAYWPQYASAAAVANGCRAVDRRRGVAQFGEVNDAFVIERLEATKSAAEKRRAEMMVKMKQQSALRKLS